MLGETGGRSIPDGSGPRGEHRSSWQPEGRRSPRDRPAHGFPRKLHRHLLRGRDPEGYQSSLSAAEVSQAPALRAILGAPARPEVHALAATWLSRARDPSDIPRLASCLDSAEPAGVFPVVVITQAAQRCYSLHFAPKTLGRACIDAVGRITSQDFATAADVRSWMKSHADPLDSYDYWAKLLSISHPAPDDLLERLHHHSPELYFRVAVLEPDILGKSASSVFDDVARNGIGGDRILRLLRKQETFPELATPGHLATFSTTVLRRAREIFGPQHGPELLALWEKRACCSEDYVRAALAVAVSRLVPDQSQRVLSETLKELRSAQAPVLEELARVHSTEQRATLGEWFYGEASKHAGDEDELATAILRGLQGTNDRAGLRFLLQHKTPNADRAVVEQLIATASAAGYQPADGCRGYLGAGVGKTWSTEERQRKDREATATRQKCMQATLKWIGQKGAK